MRLNIQAIPSKLFTVTRNENRHVLTAEISDLGPGFRFQLLYDDAMDVGMAVESSKTGNVVHYYLYDTIDTAEGDVSYWILMPTTESIRQYPLCKNTEIMLFND